MHEQQGCPVLRALRLGTNVRIDQGINFLSHVFARSTLSQVSAFSKRPRLYEKHLRCVRRRSPSSLHRSVTHFPCQNPVTRSKFLATIASISFPPKGIALRRLSLPSSLSTGVSTQKFATIASILLVVEESLQSIAGRCLNRTCFHCFHSLSIGSNNVTRVRTK